MVSPAASAATSRSIARVQIGHARRAGAGRRGAGRGSAPPDPPRPIPRATSSRAVSGRIRIAVASAATFDSSIDGACQAIAVDHRPRYHREPVDNFFHLQAFGLFVTAAPDGAAWRPCCRLWLALYFSFSQIRIGLAMKIDE